MQMNGFGLVAIFALVGCGPTNKSDIPIPAYDAAASAAAALAQYDKNGNGSIEGAEFDASPGLKQLLASTKPGPEKKLNADDLKKRFEGYVAEKVGAMTVRIRLLDKNKPVPNADLTFMPENFMLGSIPTSTARTNAEGIVFEFNTAERSVPGLPPGVYRVTASTHPNAVLGCEVSAGGRGSGNNIDLIVP